MPQLFEFGDEVAQRFPHQYTACGEILDKVGATCGPLADRGVDLVAPRVAFGQRPVGPVRPVDQLAQGPPSRIVDHRKRHPAPAPGPTGLGWHSWLGVLARSDAAFDDGDVSRYHAGAARQSERSRGIGAGGRT